MAHDELVKRLRELGREGEAAGIVTIWGRAADRIEQQAAEIERLREALEFYADAANYKYLPHAGCSQIEAEGGDLARAALGQEQ